MAKKKKSDLSFYFSLILLFIALAVAAIVPKLKTIHEQCAFIDVTKQPKTILIT